MSGLNRLRIRCFVRYRFW